MATDAKAGGGMGSRCLTENTKEVRSTPTPPMLQRSGTREAFQKEQITRRSGARAARGGGQKDSVGGR